MSRLVTLHRSRVRAGLLKGDLIYAASVDDQVFAARCLASQSRWSYRCEHTSYSHVLIFYMYICRILLIQLLGCHIEINACLIIIIIKDAWRSRRQSFVKEWCCWLVRHLISCKRRSMVLETVCSDPLCWWDGRWSASRVAIVSSGGRRGCCDGNSSSAVVTTATVWWWSSLHFRIRRRTFFLAGQSSDNGSDVISVKCWLD